MSAEGNAFRVVLEDTVFQLAVDLGLKATATAVLGEATSSGTLKDKRHALAHDIITDTYSIASVLAWREAIASDSTTDGSATQAAMNSRISAIFNDVAGVHTEDTGGV